MNKRILSVLVISLACAALLTGLSYFVTKPYPGRVGGKDAICLGVNQSDQEIQEMSSDVQSRLSKSQHGWPFTYAGLSDSYCPMNADLTPRFKARAVVADMGIYFLATFLVVSGLALARSKHE